MRYNENFENRIKVFRSARRPLVASSINFGCSRANFEALIRARLTIPHSVQFFWRTDGLGRNRHHHGFAMLGFDRRENRERAEIELTGRVIIDDRMVIIRRASREAYRPQAATTAAPTTPAAANQTSTPAASFNRPLAAPSMGFTPAVNNNNNPAAANPVVPAQPRSGYHYRPARNNTHPAPATDRNPSASAADRQAAPSRTIAEELEENPWARR